jgi:hypothetical protein
VRENAAFKLACGHRISEKRSNAPDVTAQAIYLVLFNSVHSMFDPIFGFQLLVAQWHFLVFFEAGSLIGFLHGLG